MTNKQKKEFEKLREQSIAVVNSLAARGDDINSALGKSYNDPTHFIYEILQNAEDENANKIEFKLFEDRLDIYHDGKPFNFDDIKGIVGIANSKKKKKDPSIIGYFGLGFKSVYEVTQTPYIFSGDYKFKIEKRLINSYVDDNDQFYSDITKDTLIRLPLDQQFGSPEKFLSLISNKLENISLKTLLFLRNIKEIKWQTPSSNGYYLKSSKCLGKDNNIYKVTLKSSNIIEKYLVAGKPIILDGIKTKKGKKPRIEIAYKLGKDERGKKIILSEPDSKFVVFFPTNQDTYLHFIIQGPYNTTSSRENILLEDEQNIKIIKETGNLIAESLSIIRDLGYLDVNFLNVLPIKQEHADDQIYQDVYQKVKEKLLSERLLPTIKGKHAKADNSLLARGKGLTEFLNNKDILKLFSKQNWLDSTITYDVTRELRDYLINELKVEEVDFKNFAEKIDADFLKKKTDKWMIDFYKRLLDSDKEALWSDKNYPPGILRTKPIIRLETNELIAPFDDKGEIQVYLPSKTRSKYYKTVKRIFAKGNSLKFLSALGIKEPDRFDEIKEYILPKYQIDNPVKDEEYLEDIGKYLWVYKTKDGRKEEFMKELSKASFIDSVNNMTEENRLRKPSETYFKDNNLKNYFDGYNSVFFVSEELYKKFGKGKLEPFLKELGVEDKPRRIEISVNWSWEEQWKLHDGKGYCSDFRDYEYEGLENFIKEITVEKSLLLWKLLLKNIEDLNYQEAENFFKGKRIWHWRGEKPEYFDDVKFLKTLREQAWLVEKNNKFKKPCEITFSELSDDYLKDSQNIEVLKNVLEFKSDIINLLPNKDHREIMEMVIKRGITPQQVNEAFPDTETKEEIYENNKETWIQECEPDKAEVNITEPELNTIVIPDLSDQGSSDDIVGNKELTKNEKESEEDVNTTSVNRKAIGNWGEKHVYFSLREKYQKDGFVTETDMGFEVEGADNELFEIVWLNKQSEGGVGYDFVIKKNGEEIEYIEVKTNTQEKPESVEVTGMQWGFARKLFDKSEGDKYFFYVVLNAGKGNPHIIKLKNPIKLWKEGKLRANPVSIWFDTYIECVSDRHTRKPIRIVRTLGI